jgi:uncharacterized repeat protein (TIGR03803 family)
MLIAGLACVLAGPVTAQTFKVLHAFTATSQDTPFSNSDGKLPISALVLSGNSLYGTAHYGGTSGAGAVFAVSSDGTGFVALHSFAAFPDGAYPNAGLLLAGDTLYGTAYQGGIWQAGTVFGISTNGTGFTNLYNFTGGSDGALPHAALILSGSTLYGTTLRGGNNDSGVVFGVNTNGTGFTNLYSFTGGIDGRYPYGGLVLHGDTLYGTAYFGGTAGTGTVFAINTDGTGFTNLYSFTGGGDGASPYAGLILSGDTLYGTTFGGFGTVNGSVFAINTDGTGFTNLHTFTATSGSAATNSDGAKPRAGLILSGNTLYGTASSGGSSGNGTVFAVNTNGTGFTNMYSFTASSGSQLLSYTNCDGANPYGGLVLSGNILYGTAAYGGISGNGTVFSLSFPPQLTIIPSGPYVILTWPTNYAGFDYTGFVLQSTTNLVSPVWATVSPGPVVIGSENIVINTVTGTGQFYRLRQ